jgi:hypothetical protein
MHSGTKRKRDDTYPFTDAVLRLVDNNNMDGLVELMKTARKDDTRSMLTDSRVDIETLRIAVAALSDAERLPILEGLLRGAVPMNYAESMGTGAVYLILALESSLQDFNGAVLNRDQEAQLHAILFTELCYCHPMPLYALWLFRERSTVRDLWFPSIPPTVYIDTTWTSSLTLPDQRVIDKWSRNHHLFTHDFVENKHARLQLVALLSKAPRFHRDVILHRGWRVSQDKPNAMSCLGSIRTTGLSLMATTDDFKVANRFGNCVGSILVRAGTPYIFIGALGEQEFLLPPFGSLIPLSEDQITFEYVCNPVFLVSSTALGGVMRAMNRLVAPRRAREEREELHTVPLTGYGFARGSRALLGLVAAAKLKVADVSNANDAVINVLYQTLRRGTSDQLTSLALTPNTTSLSAFTTWLNTQVSI